jgi:SAM-dependent methyltransferase
VNSPDRTLGMGRIPGEVPAGHRSQTRDAYDQLAPVWADTTDDGPFNGHLERPALRGLIPQPLTGKTVMDAGCGSGAQCEWLLERGADVIGFDLSPGMVEQARRRCGERARLIVADLAEELPVDDRALDGITCSLALHYVDDWAVPLQTFARVLRPGGWLVVSLDHPFGPPLPTQTGGYFDTELVSDMWVKQGVEVTQQFWRRPLSAAIDAFSNAGFLVDRIVEPQPSADALRQFPEELGGINGIPWFIVYRLIFQGL